LKAIGKLEMALTVQATCINIKPSNMENINGFGTSKSVIGRAEKARSLGKNPKTN
jgi:hypothetical protein